MDESETAFFKPIYIGNGFGHMNINLTGLNELNLFAGDEIAAYEGNNCIGAVKLQESNIDKNIVSIKASASDKDVSNGFTEGNIIELRIWLINSNTEFQLFSEVIKGDMIYQRQGSVFAQLLEKINIETGTDYTLEFSIYPNPANNIATIKFSTLPETGTKIILMDIVGNFITSRKVESSINILDISTLAPGIYLVKALSGMNNYIKKLIIT